MQVQGRVRRLIDEFRVGFITVKGMDDVFFSAKHSKFQNTSFDKLKAGDTVRIDFVDTPRGPFAEVLQPSKLEGTTASGKGRAAKARCSLEALA